MSYAQEGCLRPGPEPGRHFYLQLRKMWLIVATAYGIICQKGGIGFPVFSHSGASDYARSALILARRFEELAPVLESRHLF